MMRIDATDLTLRYASGLVPLDAVSFSLAAGDFCAVQGESGAGKSTLLGILGGHIAHGGGRVFVDGHLLNAATLGYLRPHIGQVYQDHRLVGQASVLANIAAGTAATLPLWRALCNVFPKPVRKRATELLNALGMDDALLDRPASTLSGGQAQRIGIARALIGKPRLVLADEPVASLDPETARRTLAVLADFARESGATVICALHQPDLALAFANRALVLDHGHLTEKTVHSGRSAA